MTCPKCGEDHNMVHRTDDSSYLPHVRRARLCLCCHHVFETVETATGDPYFKRKGSHIEPSLFDDIQERKASHADDVRVSRHNELQRRKVNG